MTDLVAELRDSCDCSGLSNPSGVCLKCRAADEIERLTAHVRACEAAWIDERGWLRAERDRLGRDLTEALNRATAHFGEIQRLRAALRDVGALLVAQRYIEAAHRIELEKEALSQAIPCESAQDNRAQPVETDARHFPEFEDRLKR